MVLQNVRQRTDSRKFKDFCKSIRNTKKNKRQRINKYHREIVEEMKIANKVSIDSHCYRIQKNDS